MDISKLSVDELLEFQSRIPEEIRKRKSAEKQNVIDELATIALARGYSLEELLTKPRKSRTVIRASGTKKVAPKYRHPKQNDLTWTGRGRKPAWVAEWLAQGKPLQELAI
jgi:DNA-binding protein H-NS